jgi:hypothetical protein
MPRRETADDAAEHAVDAGAAQGDLGSPPVLEEQLVEHHADELVLLDLHPEPARVASDVRRFRDVDVVTPRELFHEVARLPKRSMTVTWVPLV